jgi:TetR/AcrR family transcriptional repressor of nem operon
VGAVKTLPTTDRGRATLERILDAASELFYHRGIHATGLEHVVEASGTGKGQLYHYFASKHDLVLAVIDRQIELVLDAQQPLLGTIATGADLRAWADLVVELHAAGDSPARCPLGALAAELAEDDPLAREALRRGFARWRDELARGLRRMRAVGELRAQADPDTLAEGLLAAYEGGLVLSQVRGDLDPLRAALDLALAGF